MSCKVQYLRGKLMDLWFISTQIEYEIAEKQLKDDKNECLVEYGHLAELNRRMSYLETQIVDAENDDISGLGGL